MQVNCEWCGGTGEVVGNGDTRDCCCRCDGTGMAGGENDDLAAEVDKLHRLLDQSSNYVADDAARPQVMQFNNGRTVRIIADADGSYLDTDFVPPKEIPQPPPTQDELQALENLKNSDFIPRLLAGEFDTI